MDWGNVYDDAIMNKNGPCPKEAIVSEGCSEALEVERFVAEIHGAAIPDGLARAIENLGHLVGVELEERLSGADGRSRFEKIWDEARKGRREHPREWARVLVLMAQATSCVDRMLPGGQLPIVEMAGWGSEFYCACEAFSLAGANCWKRDIRRARFVDVAKNCPKLRLENWVRDAMSRDDRFETTSVKLDLQFDDINFGPDFRALPKPSCEEWAERFEWESKRRSSSFDVECAWILTSKFTPKQALSIWRRALGDEGIPRKDLSVWVLGCKWGNLADLPDAKDLLPLSTRHMSVYLGQAALARAKEDAAVKDPERVDGWMDALMDACEACSVDFLPAAKVLEQEALDWTQRSYTVLGGDVLSSAVVRACARWEARVFNLMLSPAIPASRARHL